jgi:lipopolysaccharide export system protein LptC
MDLYPARQYAETDQDVMIDSHIGRTTATGLEGDLQLGMLRFFSSRSARVHTVLLPEQFK